MFTLIYRYESVNIILVQSIYCPFRNSDNPPALPYHLSKRKLYNLTNNYVTSIILLLTC